MILNGLTELTSHIPRLRKLSGLAGGIALLLVILAIIEHSDRAIIERQNKRGFALSTIIQDSNMYSDDERRVARLFIADTLPRLMKKGLITKYERNETGTTLLVVGRVWKGRTRFVKQSLLTAVSVFNKVNDYNLWTMILDDRDGTMYAQVLPSDRRELYE